MPQLNTLVPDIYRTITRNDNDWFRDDLALQFSSELSRRVQDQFGERGKPTLRLSAMGPKCPKALWHSINTPELAEPLPPWARIKYTYGHIIEALALVLAKAAGHEVVGEQDELWVDGIRGHRDCVIDGCIVDVKSSSSRGMEKFKSKDFSAMDDFGYLDQLDGYLVGSAGDPLVTVKDRAYILAIDKTLGHMVLYEHRLRHDHILQRIQTYKDLVNQAVPPGCTCPTVKDGESGNRKLAFPATYSPQKYSCFPHLRTFLYSDGIRYLTTVKREPAAWVKEVDRNGHFIH